MHAPTYRSTAITSTTSNAVPFSEPFCASHHAYRCHHPGPEADRQAGDLLVQPDAELRAAHEPEGRQVLLRHARPRPQAHSSRQVSGDATQARARESAGVSTEPGCAPE